MVYSFLHRYGRTPKEGIIHQSNRRYACYSIGQPSVILLKILVFSSIFQALSQRYIKILQIMAGNHNMQRFGQLLCSQNNKFWTGTERRRNNIHYTHKNTCMYMPTIRF